MTKTIAMRAIYLGLCIAAFAAVSGNPAAAQDFPTKPLRLVVPYPPSGNVDITARTISPALGEALGQPIVIDNRAGAGGTIGTTAVVKSPADGYTLVLGSSATITAGPAVYKHPPYDPLKDLVAIGAVQLAPIVLTVAPKTPVHNFAEFVERAKARPGQVTIASAGNGSSNHLAIELLMRAANLDLLHVPYKGSGPALTDLIGSQVEAMMDQLTSSIGHIREGRIRAIAIASRQRSPDLPDVPTLDEAGVKGYEASTFTGVFAPAATPAPVVGKLAAALRKVMSGEEVRQRFRTMGVEVMDMTREQFVDYVRADFDKWSKVAHEAHIVIE